MVPHVSAADLSAAGSAEANLQEERSSLTRKAPTLPKGLTVPTSAAYHRCVYVCGPDG